MPILLIKTKEIKIKNIIFIFKNVYKVASIFEREKFSLKCDEILSKFPLEFFKDE